MLAKISFAMLAKISDVGACELHGGQGSEHPQLGDAHVDAGGHDCRVKRHRISSAAAAPASR
jgi:hypothetical protein